MTAASGLQLPDILLIILSLLDPPTLLSFRLTSPRINSIITTHQRSICNSIASHTHSTNLDFLPSPDSPALLLHLQNLHIKALLRIPRAKLLAARAVTHSDPIYGPRETDPSDDGLRAHCTRGILVFWALVDIQQSVSPNKGSVPRYVPGLPAAVVPASKRRGIVARLFRTRKREPATNAAAGPVTAATCVSPALDTIETPSSPDADRTFPTSASAVTQRFATIKAAQQPFVSLLSRPTRVDLELAQGYLHWLMPFDLGGCFGGPSLTYKEQCWWKESWALRQGPAFLLAVCSADAGERSWALDRMEQEWKGRRRAVVEAERTTPIFLFRDEGMAVGEKPLWEAAWEIRGRRGLNGQTE
ncbi:hypothetical protein MMC13_003760 [Lambiella insularis]|nr:hypothetical protein [Lambiella insularis]